MNVEQTIREYLEKVIHLSLATSKDDKPWVCEVHFAFDEELNLYFRSTPVRRHSVEISSNPNVAGNIILPHELGEKVQGVYFEGIAELLNEVTENDSAYKVMASRFDRNQDILEEALTDTGHKFYKISVSTFYLFDSKDSNPSQKYELPWLSKS